MGDSNNNNSFELSQAFDHGTDHIAREEIDVSSLQHPRLDRTGAGLNVALDFEESEEISAPPAADPLPQAREKLGVTVKCAKAIIMGNRNLFLKTSTKRSTRQLRLR